MSTEDEDREWMRVIFFGFANQLEALVDEFGYGDYDNPELRNRAHDLRWDLISWTNQKFPPANDTIIKRTVYDD